jgi:ADP-heptose:LPS heptosyltransferase
MFFLTNRIGKKITKEDKNEIIREDVKRVLICRPNHRLGNQLLLTPLVQEVFATFPNCTIDLFVKGGLDPIIFKNYDYVENIIQLPKKHFKQIVLYLKGWSVIRKTKYDIAINAVKNSSSGRLATRFAKAKNHIFGENENEFDDNYTDAVHMAKYPIYSFRDYIAAHGIKSDNHKLPFIDIKLSAEELAEGKIKHDVLLQNNKQTICLFTNATGNKCYSKVWWLDFYENLKIKFPNQNIIEILPVENTSMIDFQATSFYSKDIRAMASLMASTSVFIGADSGIMHLASAAHIPVLGLFSGLNMEKYKPYNFNSLGFNTNDSDNESIYKSIQAILD